MTAGPNGGRPAGAPSPRLRSNGNRPASIGALGEGLLEVGVDPELSQELLARGYGGDAANAVVMAARLGARTRLLSRVGGDAAGRLLLEFWRAAGIDLGAVEVDRDGETGLYINEVAADGSHAFSYHRTGSAASRLSPTSVDAAALGGLDVLHVTGVTLAISAAAAAASEHAVAAVRAAGGKVSFAVNHRAQLAPDGERLLAMARAADLVFLSVEDARALLGLDDAREIVAALGPGPAEVIVTDGPEPAWLFAGGEVRRVAPPEIVLIDAAGAGDALAGAFLARRFSGGSPLEALTTGVVAGALSCRARGCARTYPAAAEVDAALARLTSGPVVSS